MYYCTFSVPVEPKNINDEFQLAERFISLSFGQNSMCEDEYSYSSDTEDDYDDIYEDEGDLETYMLNMFKLNISFVSYFKCCG